MAEPILQTKAIDLFFENINILCDVNISLYPGETHIVFGENGAGKSSLAKVLCGIYPQHGGTIELNGKEVQISSPEEARKQGIISIHQNSTVFENLSVAENIFVNHPDHFKSAFSLLNKAKLNKMTADILKRLNFTLDPNEKVKYLDLAQRRMIELARISLLNPRVLILDEPTASLTLSEAQAFIDVMASFKKQGAAIMVITHQVRELSKFADRITILRDGKVVATEEKTAFTLDDISQKIWGKYYTNKYPKLDLKSGKEVFCVEDLCTQNLLDHITFSLHKGEILGITGLVGSGRSQLAKAIFGQHPRTKGTFYVDRLKAKIDTPKDAIEHGIAFVTEDRYDNGLFSNLDVLKNVFSVNNSFNNKFFINQKQNLKLFKKNQEKVNLNISAPHVKMFPTLSGGTQQKILLMRWIFSFSKIFIFDEPTHGVDIASKVDIYNLINDLARKGAGILLISSSFEEVTGMCDRILILKDGQIAHEAKRSTPGDYDDLFEYVI